MTENVERNESTTTLENASRRKAVKTIVGGVTAVAAYNLLPAKWGTPIIESIFLPAHAATSAEVHAAIDKIENNPDTGTITASLTFSETGSYTVSFTNATTGTSAIVTINVTTQGPVTVTANVEHTEGDTINVAVDDASSKEVVPPTPHVATPPPVAGA